LGNSLLYNLCIKQKEIEYIFPQFHKKLTEFLNDCLH